MSNWIKGKVEIFKIHDGEKTKVYEDNNVVTTGMGYALCNLFTEQEDQEVENFQIGYFQLGTGQIPVSTMQTPRVFYTLSAGFGTSDYGSNLDTEIKDLSLLGSILPSNPNFGIDLEYQYTNIDASYNQLMALRPNRFLYTRDVAFNNNVTTSTFNDLPASIFNFSCYRESPLQDSRFMGGLLSSISSTGLRLFFDSTGISLFSFSGIFGNSTTITKNTPLSFYSTTFGIQNNTSIAIGTNTIYLTQQYTTNQGVRTLLKELTYINQYDTISPIIGGFYDALTVSTISGSYNVQNGFQGQEVESLIPTGKHCTLIKANRVSDNTKFWYLVGCSGATVGYCENFKNVRNYLTSVTNVSDFYPLEIVTNPTSNLTRLVLIKKDLNDNLTSINLPVDTNPNEVVPSYAVTAIPESLQYNNLHPAYITTISLTQERKGGNGVYAIALDSNHRLTAWGFDPNNSIITQIPPELQGNCAAVKLSGNKAHAISLDGTIYSWGTGVAYPMTNTAIINPETTEPVLDTSAYGFAELAESRKLQLQNNSNKYRIFLDKGMAAGKTIKEIGLFIKNPNVDYNIDKPILAAYKALNFNLIKTSEFELMIDWSISITDGA